MRGFRADLRIEPRVHTRAQATVVADLRIADAETATAKQIYIAALAAPDAPTAPAPAAAKCGYLVGRFLEHHYNVKTDTTEMCR